MIMIDKPFPKNCRECIFWKNQFCNVISKKISYEEAGIKQKECKIIDGKNSKKG